MKIGNSDKRSESDPMLEETESLSKPWCYFLFLLIAGHLLAVFSEPFHFFARSEIQTASDATAIRNLVRPYSQWMFLDHGYFFFAPNPGPGHLLRIVASDDPVPPLPDDRRSTPLDEVERLDGDGHKARMLPDRSNHWPRLLYHRYFMLSEFYYSRYAPRAISRELSADAAFASRWQLDRELYGALRQSIEHHFRNKNHSPFLRIDRVERSLPPPEIILKQQVRLSDRRWLSVLPESMDLELLPSGQPNAEAQP